MIGDFFKVKQIPTLFWSAPRALTLRPPFISVVLLSIGLVIFAIGEGMIVAAGIGVSPWTVFAQGLSSLSGWTVGFSTFITSMMVLLLWIPLRQMPGLGTILNALIIAIMLDVSLHYLPRPELFIQSVIMAVCGVMLVGFGSAVYLIANLGAGPRDGLMTGLQRLSGQPIMNVRIAIEIIVVVSGWLMGGMVGLGTMLFAFGIGPAVSFCAHSLFLLFKK